MATASLWVGGDLWAGVSAQELGAAEAPRADFVLQRLEPWVGGRLGSGWSARFAVRARLGGEADPAAWTAAVRDAWVEGAFGGEVVQHRLRVGVQELAVGDLRGFEAHHGYFLGGEATADLVRLSGALPAEDLGATWSTALGEGLEGALQLTRGEGGEVEGPAGWVDGAFVVRARPVAGLSARAGLRTGLRDGVAGEARYTVGEAAVEVRGGPEDGGRGRVLGEVLYGGLANEAFSYPRVGALLAGAVELPLTGERVDHLALVGRGSVSDPVLGNGAPDGTYGGAAAAHVYWVDEAGRVVMSGLGWEVEVPQSLGERVAHALTLQVAAGF